MTGASSEVYLSPLDLGIVAVYLIATVVAGVLASRAASSSMRGYFLGGNDLPWYMLGLSNASGMFDIAGTMWMVYLLYVYGLKSIWLPWLWPVFNQVFLAAYLSQWLRRSGVMTGAEWITFRFGSTVAARAAHGVVVLFALFNVVCFIAFSFVGIGKFASRFIAYRLAEDATMNDQLWGLVFVAVTTIYVVKGGMTGVVVTEVMQFGIMSVASVMVGVVAMLRVPDPMAAIAGRVPDGWTSPWFGADLGMNWAELLPAASDRVHEDGMGDTFAAFFALMTAKGVLQAMSGPAPNYDMQRVLAARTPSDAARMSALVSAVLLVPRYMMVTGLTLLAIKGDFPDAQQKESGTDDVDFEAVLPFAMREFLPQGLRGLLVAALLSAFMSTFAATVNAAPAYLVNDVYRKYIAPEASERRCVRLSYVVAVVAVGAGVGVGFYVNSLNDILQWIVGALYGGYTAPNVLKFHWWRFNAHGYFWGMFTGIVAAMVVPLLAPFKDIAPLYAFPAIFVVSLTASISASLLTQPDPPAVLDEFYRRVRPWGFWEPVANRVCRPTPVPTSDNLPAEMHPLSTNITSSTPVLVKPLVSATASSSSNDAVATSTCGVALDEPRAAIPTPMRNTDFAKDAFNVVVGVAWQTALTLLGCCLVLRLWTGIAAAVITVGGTALVLKFTWYDRLLDYPTDDTRGSAEPSPASPKM